MGKALKIYLKKIHLQANTDIEHEGLPQRTVILTDTPQRPRTLPSYFFRNIPLQIDVSPFTFRQ